MTNQPTANAVGWFCAPTLQYSACLLASQGRTACAGTPFDNVLPTCLSLWGLSEAKSR